MKLRYCRNKCQYFFHTGINCMVKSWNLQGGILKKIADKLELHSLKSHKMGILRELANVIFHLFFQAQLSMYSLGRWKFMRSKLCATLEKFSVNNFMQLLQRNCSLEWKCLKCTYMYMYICTATIVSIPKGNFPIYSLATRAHLMHAASKILRQPISFQNLASF